jgi:hypothetical protein
MFKGTVTVFMLSFRSAAFHHYLASIILHLGAVSGISSRT